MRTDRFEQQLELKQMSFYAMIFPLLKTAAKFPSNHTLPSKMHSRVHCYYTALTLLGYPGQLINLSNFAIQFQKRMYIFKKLLTISAVHC